MISDLKLQMHPVSKALCGSLLWAILIVFGCTFPLSLAADEPTPKTPAQNTKETPAGPSVGMRQRLKQVVLPGPELVVVEIDDRTSPIILGIEEVYPHGSDFRYDFVYQGLEPGEYDLTKWLRRKDGTPVTGLKPLLVNVAGAIPPGQIEPNPPSENSFRQLGSYRLLIMVGTILWLVLGWFILFSGKPKKAVVPEAQQKPKNLADRLRPVVQRARQGQLSQSEMAELERLLLAYWRRRLKLGNLPLAESSRQLKEHPEAGPLIHALEQWLHSGGAPAVDNDATVTALLAPYEHIQADALDASQVSDSTPQKGQALASQGVGN